MRRSCDSSLIPARPKPFRKISNLKTLRVQKQTAEEEGEQLRRTIFVGNLPASWKGKAVKRLFLECASPVVACYGLFHSCVCLLWGC